MTAKQADPGSYTVQDDPFDDFQGTKVPLHTPLGPVTLHFLDAGEVFMISGYETGEYSRQASGNTTDEAFTWRGAEVIGAQNFRLKGGAWLPLTNRNFPGHNYGSPRFSARGTRNITDKMAQDIVAYWTEVIRRYTAEHPAIPAHAALRRSVKLLADQESAIAEAEQRLALMRKARANFRHDVRRTFIAERTAGEPSGLDAPRPYTHETTNGYVLELENDASLVRQITSARSEQTS